MASDSVLNQVSDAVGVRQLGAEAHRIVRDLPGSGRVVPVSRNGEVVGVMLETSLSDIAKRGLLEREDRFVSVRDFVRGNMSRHVGMVADEGEALVVWKRATPTVIMVPFAKAVQEGLLPGLDDEGRPGPRRALSAQETTSGTEAPEKSKVEAPRPAARRRAERA